MKYFSTIRWKSWIPVHSGRVKKFNLEGYPVYTIQRDFHDAPRLYETQKNGDAITYSRKLEYKT